MTSTLGFDRFEVAEIGNLTPRQRQILSLAAQGKTISEAAVIMHISHSTAHVHWSCAIAKMRAANICHAVAKAVVAGLV